jgi:hypothetical protein
MISHGTNQTLEVSGASNPVLWQSVFWGLVPFALNSMTQPSGIICGADADVGFLLRSSPIIGIIDALLILVQFFSYYRSTKSFPKASEKLIAFRFQSDIYDYLKKEKNDNKEAAAKKKWEQNIRIIIFLVTFSQVVKLFAVEGLIWVRVVAALYLASFVITEILVVWPAAYMAEIKKSDDTHSGILIPYTSVAAAVAFMLWFASAAFRDIFGEPQHALLQWSAKVIGSMGAGLAIPALGYAFRHCRVWTEIRSSAALLIIVLGSPVGFYFTGQMIPPSIPLVWLQVFGAMVAAVWVGVALVYASATTSLFRQAENVRQRKKVEQVTAWYFFLLHIATALLFFLFSYDSAETNKPWWTEYLG